MADVLLPIRVESLEEGGYLAICDVIQGCHAEGETVEESLEYVEDVARIIIELYQEDNLPLPEELANVEPAAIKVELVGTARA